MQKFKVLRQHLGDQFYDPSGIDGPAEREAEPLEVRHLVSAGVLEALGNKADTAAPETKAQVKAREKAEAEKAEADAKAKAEAEEAAAKAEAERAAEEASKAAEDAKS